MKRLGSGLQMVHLLNGCVAVFDVQVRSCGVYVFGNVGSAIVVNYTLAGHCTDGSFNRRYLRIEFLIQQISYAAAAAGLRYFCQK